VCVRFVHRAIGVEIFGFLVLSGGRCLTLRGGNSKTQNSQSRILLSL